MKRIVMIALAAGLPFAVATAENNHFRADLSGYREVPVVSSRAGGELRVRIEGSAIHFKLSYARLQGDVTQAHIHFGQRGVNGGVAVWLCSNLASPPTPAGVQPCPASPATIIGIITASDVVGPEAQGIAPGEYNELVRAIRIGKAYGNVHTTLFPGGEARDQLHVRHTH